MEQIFINRKVEQKIIDDVIKKAGIIVIYGRRRVGKTRLVTHWGKSNRLVYTQAIEASESIQIKQIFDDLRSQLPIDVEPQSWIDFFKLLAQIKKNITIAIDEFPYLVESNPSLPSIFQRWIDHEKPDRLAIIILGSSQSMMHDLFLNANAPLFSRADRMLRVVPMNYKSFAEFLKIDKINRESFLKFSITGGVPKYWEIVNPSETAVAFADRIFFSDFSYFENEPLHILKDEKIGGLRPLSILEAIGRGAAKPSVIANKIGTPQTDLSRPLQVLLDSSIISRELPFGESIRSTKKVLYYISDYALRFWFNIYSPHRSRWHLYTSEKKEQLLTYHAASVLEQEFKNIYKDSARYWEGKDIEFDCIRYKDQTLKNVIITEIKWQKLTKPKKQSIQSTVKDTFFHSVLSKKFPQAEFEVFSFEDIVKRL